MRESRIIATHESPSAETLNVPALCDSENVAWKTHLPVHAFGAEYPSQTGLTFQ